jgi:hypothetical protein
MAYGAMEVEHRVLTSALNEVEWSGSRFGRIIHTINRIRDRARPQESIWTH